MDFRRIKDFWIYELFEVFRLASVYGIILHYRHTEFAISVALVSVEYYSIQSLNFKQKRATFRVRKSAYLNILDARCSAVTYRHGVHRGDLRLNETALLPFDRCVPTNFSPETGKWPWSLATGPEQLSH